MEQQQRSVVFTAAVGLIILAIIVGSVYYLVKFVQSRVSSSSASPQPSVEAIVEASASPNSVSVQGDQVAPIPGVATPAPAPVTPPVTGPATGPAAGNPPAGKKLYNSGTFQVTYPNNWGLLTCTNSANFELDPLSAIDSKIACNTALKSVTVLVNNIDGCSGPIVKLGVIDVMKTKQTAPDGYIRYQWCTKTDPVLNFTHRVSKNKERATSPTDYSSQVEEIISRLTFARGS